MGYGTRFSLAVLGALVAGPLMAAQAAPVATEITDETGTKMMGDPDKGKTIFKQCQTCHVNEEGKNKVGPSLYGVIGRTAGTVEGYNYSKANKESGIVWTEQEMFVYLEDPRAKIPGTKMTFAGLKDKQDRVDVIAYLQEDYKAKEAAKTGGAPAAPAPTGQ
jgi:cytochrome c